jgi:hypothetical protein
VSSFYEPSPSNPQKLNQFESSLHLGEEGLPASTDTREHEHAHAHEQHRTEANVSTRAFVSYTTKRDAEKNILPKEETEREGGRETSQKLDEVQSLPQDEQID